MWVISRCSSFWGSFHSGASRVLTCFPGLAQLHAAYHSHQLLSQNLSRGSCTKQEDQKRHFPLEFPHTSTNKSLREQANGTLSWSITLLPALGADVNMRDECRAVQLNSILIENYVLDRWHSGLHLSPSIQNAWIYSYACIKSPATSHKYAQVSICLHNKYYKDHNEIKMELNDGCPPMIYRT